MTDRDARSRLLDAAKRLLWERGFAATSPRAVMADSGVGQGSLYHHFPTKKALAEAALDDIADDLIAETDRLLADETQPPLDRLRAWLSRPRDGLKGCRMGRLAGDPEIFDAALHGPSARYFDYLRGRVAACLRQAQTDGPLRDDLDADAMAAALVSVIQGGYVLSRTSSDAQAITQATSGAMAMLDALSDGREGAGAVPTSIR